MDQEISFLAGIISSVDCTCREHKKKKKDVALPPSPEWDMTARSRLLAVEDNTRLRIRGYCDHNHRVWSYIESCAYWCEYHCVHIFLTLFCTKLCTTQDIFVGNQLLGGRHFLVVTDSLHGANYSLKQANGFQAGKKITSQICQRRKFSVFVDPQCSPQYSQELNTWSIT
jgi:hypothetical protein